MSCDVLIKYSKKQTGLRLNFIHFQKTEFLRNMSKRLWQFATVLEFSAPRCQYTRRIHLDEQTVRLISSAFSELAGRLLDSHDALGHQVRVEADTHAQSELPESEILRRYAYNDRSELTEESDFSPETSSGVAVETEKRSYEYDSIGNRTRYKKGDLEENYTVNELNQRIAKESGAGGATALSYDAGGNMTSDGEGSVFEWDAENRLTKVQKPGVTAEYCYDASGRRIEKRVTAAGQTEITRFTYDAWRIVYEEKSTEGNAAAESVTYGWGLDINNSVGLAGNIGALLSREINRPGGREFYRMLADGNGNVAGSLSESGKFVNAGYDAFGIPNKNADTGAFGFSTKYTDRETGLVCFGYRYYNPSAGTWLNRDPKGVAGGVNLTAFVFNNPVNCFDALGLAGVSKWIPTTFSQDDCLKVYYKFGEKDGSFEHKLTGALNGTAGPFSAKVEPGLDSNGEVSGAFGADAQYRGVTASYTATADSNGVTQSFSGEYRDGNLTVSGKVVIGPNGKTVQGAVEVKSPIGDIKAYAEHGSSGDSIGVGISNKGNGFTFGGTIDLNSTNHAASVNVYAGLNF